MKVKIIAYTSNPEKVVAAAAMASYKKEIPELKENTDEQAAKEIEEKMSFGHVSIIEHTNFTFAVSEVSRALTHQLVRHRVASYTQQSQRYVKFVKKGFGHVVPKTVEENSEKEINEGGSSQTTTIGEKFENLMSEIQDCYNLLVENGVKPEDARFVLPNACYTNIVITMNARELLHFFGLRCCDRAQWEIREMADKMLKLCKEKAPAIFENAGPNCQQLGYCPEGKQSCGKVSTIEELKEKARKD
jgi:thymidylate synthase (FAD)